MIRSLALTALLVVAPLSAEPLQAELIHLEVISVVPFDGGRAFGSAGPYELVIARGHFAVDPSDPANAGIVDLALAPRDAEGRVRFTADVHLLRPVDPARGNGTLLVEIVNRGGARGLAARAEAGASGTDRFVAERGFTLAWVGWEIGVEDGLVGLVAPGARDGDAAITGQVSHRITTSAPRDDTPLPSLYPAIDPESSDHVLQRRDRIGGDFVDLSRARWRFARTADGAVVPDPGFVRLEGGFQPGPVYRLLYRSADPPVAGLGFASVRDFIAYAKSGRDPGTRADRAIGRGWSQSGRYLRDFLAAGFNADERGERVFDGLIPHIAGAGGGFFNHRFAQPTLGAAYGADPTPNDHFPFTDLPERDPFTGREAGLLDRARAQGVVPRVFYVNAASEYDDRGAALIHIRPDGSADAPIPATTRIYTLLGAPHGGPADPRPGPGLVAYLSPVQEGFVARALLVAMHRWLAEGVEPPPSRYPRIVDGTLVPHDPARFPGIPGFAPPEDVYRVEAYDFGPDEDKGILEYPPRVLGVYPTFVPAVDEDGNERAGVRLPEVEVPLGTYTGWNLRETPEGYGLAILVGGYVPFPPDRSVREASGDPRVSVEERYASRDEYLERYAAAARALIADGLVLEEDFEELMDIAERRWAFHESRPAPLPGVAAARTGTGREDR